MLTTIKLDQCETNKILYTDEEHKLELSGVGEMQKE